MNGQPTTDPNQGIQPPQPPAHPNPILVNYAATLSPTDPLTILQTLQDNLQATFAFMGELQDQLQAQLPHPPHPHQQPPPPPPRQPNLKPLDSAAIVAAHAVFAEQDSWVQTLVRNEQWIHDLHLNLFDCVHFLAEVKRSFERARIVREGCRVRDLHHSMRDGQAGAGGSTGTQG